MSEIGWVDFSSDDRQRVQNVLALLKEKGTQDELGIGQLRDAFADALFPGFSTIQTHARYFLAIPRILGDWRELTVAQRSKHPLQRYLNEHEHRLAEQMAANHKAEDLPLDGIIGHTMIERGGVKRPPSNAYWSGLRVFGLVRSGQSLGEFLRNWGGDESAPAAVLSDDGDDDTAAASASRVRYPKAVRSSWPEKVTLRLASTEAEFLAECMENAVQAQDTVVSQLLKTRLASAALGEEYDSFAAFSAWARSQCALSPKCRETMGVAAQFSLAVEGAHILFNEAIVLRGGDGEHAELRETCREAFPRWHSNATSAGVFHADAPALWRGAAGASGVKKDSIAFLDAWNAAMCAGRPKAELLHLVEQQAKQNKGQRSLLAKRQSKGLAWYGMRALEYRWPNVRRILRDIQEGGGC